MEINLWWLHAIKPLKMIRSFWSESLCLGEQHLRHGTKGGAVNWTPRSGLLRGIRWTSAVAVVFAIGCCTLASIEPYLTVDRWSSELVETDTGEDLLRHRSFGMMPTIGIGLAAWLLFLVMHATAGMMGGYTTWVVILLTIMIVLSKHVVLAVQGVPIPAATNTGLIWLRPDVIFFRNIGAWIVLFMLVSLYSRGLTLRDMFGR